MVLPKGGGDGSRQGTNTRNDPVRMETGEPEGSRMKSNHDKRLEVDFGAELEHAAL